MKVKKVHKPVAIELFAGCGGFSSGFLDAGIAVRAGFDNNASAIEAFNYNHEYRGAKGFVADLTDLSGAELLASAKVESVDLVIGGPPCQPFSIAGKQNGLRDKRGNLVFEFVRIVKELGPAAVLFENVANLGTINGGEVLEDVISGLEKLGYSVMSGVLNAAEYGVPQSRKRLFIVGLKGAVPTLPPPTHGAVAAEDFFRSLSPFVTSRDAIDDLPDVDSPEAERVHNHEPTFHSLGMLKAFAELRPGERDRKSFHDRLHPERPSYTLRAGTGNFSPLRPVHYRYDRVITVRESARIQSFPDSFIWPDWLPRLQQYRQVGNAVPPLLAKRFAEHLACLLDWRLTPKLLKGDPSSRANPIRFTREQKYEARLKRMRGASLGSVQATA
jgi:DNA (cytosine-5)-methyltransferase 1